MLKLTVAMTMIVKSKEAISTCHEESIVVSVLFVFPQVIAPCKRNCVYLLPRTRLLQLTASP